MTTLRTAAQQAIALICSARLCEVNSMSSRQEMLRLMIEATDTLRAALAEPVQEPDPTYKRIGCVQHDCEECQRRTQRKPEPVQEAVACLIGTKGSAFDSPTTKRAYTYAEQPGNVVASRLGLACNAAASQSAGDSIDRGLGLLQELQRRGFGVFDLGAEYTAPPQRKPLTEEEIVALIHPIVMADMPDEMTDYEIARAIERAIKRAHGIGVQP